MVGGGSPCAGIEQIYRWGKWWTPAAPTDLDTIKKLISVVGRQLGCGSLDFFQTSEYSPNFDNILLGEDLCNGSEANLMECKMDVFSEIKFLPLDFHAIVFTGRSKLVQYEVHHSHSALSIKYSLFMCVSR